MTRVGMMEPRFVDAMPATLDDGVLYVSMLFNTVVHRCCCGCGTRVVTPLSPVEWRLEYDGRAVSLYPSIGNHQYRCKSHYWIRQNRVEWSDAWTTREIDEGRATTHRARRAWYDRREPVQQEAHSHSKHGSTTPPTPTWWDQFISRWRESGDDGS